MDIHNPIRYITKHSQKQLKERKNIINWVMVRAIIVFSFLHHYRGMKLYFVSFTTPPPPPPPPLGNNNKGVGVFFPFLKVKLTLSSLCKHFFCQRRGPGPPRPLSAPGCYYCYYNYYYYFQTDNQNMYF